MQNLSLLRKFLKNVSLQVEYFSPVNEFYEDEEEVCKILDCQVAVGSQSNSLILDELTYRKINIYNNKIKIYISTNIYIFFFKKKKRFRICY